MAMPFLNVPAFPNVPRVLGVPPVLRDPSAPDPTVDNRPRADAASLPKAIKQTWGLFKASGELAIEPETVLAIAYRSDARIPAYPLEEGGFASFNKVDMPFDVRLTVAQGGDEKTRRDFWDALNEARSSLELFSLVMPEMTLANANVVHVALNREQRQGANVLVVDIGLQEVRLTGAQTYSKTKKSDGADKVSVGSVSPRDPKPAEANAAEAAADPVIKQSAGQ